MATGGFIKLHRKSLTSEVFADPALWRVWTWCLLRANHKPQRFRGQVIPRGSFVTAMRTAAEELGMPRSTIHGVLGRLNKLNMIRTETGRGYTVVSVCKYETYQRREKPPRTEPGRDSDAPRTQLGQIEETQESKEPPPPTPSAGSSGADGTGSGWEEVEEELYRAGLACARDSVATARENGCTPTQVREVLRFYLERRPAFGVGALYHRLRILRVGQPPEELWPPASKESHALERKKSSDDLVARQELERRQNEERRARDKAERQKLERECGEVLDGMSRKDVRELIAEVWPTNTAFYLGMMPARGSPTGILREALLMAISERREAADSVLQDSDQ